MGTSATGRRGRPPEPVDVGGSVEPVEGRDGAAAVATEPEVGLELDVDPCPLSQPVTAAKATDKHRMRTLGGNIIRAATPCGGHTRHKGRRRRTSPAPGAD